MADITTEGNKTVRCRMHKECVVPLSSTVRKCPIICADCCQDGIMIFPYYGTLNGTFL